MKLIIMLLIVMLTYLPTHSFANSYDDQGEALMGKIIPLIKENNAAGALPYMAELEKLGPRLSSPLPESFYYYYIDCLDKAGENSQALNRSKIFLKKYGKKSKYSSKVNEISTRLKEEEKAAKLEAEKDAAEAKRKAEDEKRAAREVAATELERLIYTDPQSGLQWARNGNIAGKEMNWNDAMRWAENLNYAGYSDWRLPTKEELETFAKRGGNRPSEWFNANGFSGVRSGYYWSGSTYANGTDSAWFVSMVSGYVGSNYKSSSYCVWPVRSGQ
ncbi:MAG: DUF1566 domain-containing protein [Desulfuromonadaceae bacterium]|nr:DUF1566 domain-containing protein [Desulfuromonadaceae bacterium]MDD2856268.1 DUF1566 domain-containing protein [Desulfuromonadaceae bacterium]